MRTSIYRTDELLDVIIDMQERGFDHDFVLGKEHILCLQDNESIMPEDFEILETHRCRDKIHLKNDYILYGIRLKDYDLKGILVSDQKSYMQGMSFYLWKKFNNEIIKNYNSARSVE